LSGLPSRSAKAHAGGIRPAGAAAAAVYFTCGRASRVRRRGRSTALRYPAL
jgi:hypothetical protein